MGELLTLGLDGHEASLQVDVPAPQSEQLAPTQSPVRGEEHQGPIPGIDSSASSTTWAMVGITRSGDRSAPAPRTCMG